MTEASIIIENLRMELTRARREYIKDMRWLRRDFGMIPQLSQYLVNRAFIAALDALESNTPDAVDVAIQSFRAMHGAVIKQAVWEVLEQTKVSLKTIQYSNPELFAEKTERWNQASWLFTNFNASRSRSVSGNYRKAMKILATL